MTNTKHSRGRNVFIVHNCTNFEFMSAFNPYDHLGFLTNRVARLIKTSMDHILAKEHHRIPISCIGVLADLWAEDGVNQKNLGISLVKTKSSINIMLAALEEEGLICKKEDPNDGRGKLIFLTKDGKEKQQLVETKSKELEKTLLPSCTEAEIKTAKKVLTEMYLQLCSKEENTTIG